MKLSESIEAVRPLMDRSASRMPDKAPGDKNITKVVHRSDQISAGGLFVAIRGAHVDGHRFVADAVARGAGGVVVEEDVEVPGGTTVIRVSDTRKALGLISARFYGHPADDLVMIGITGTNGKTTIAWLLEGLLAAQGFTVGVIGTINYRYGGKVFDNPLTTPEASDLQRILADMKAAGVTHVVMEVSSHGLDLERVRGCSFDVGVFSNLSQDHLDFHKTMEAYREAKKRLFTVYLRPGRERDDCAAIINVSDPAGGEIAAASGHCWLIRVGMSAENSNIYPLDADYQPSGIKAAIRTPAGTVSIDSRLAGRFNLKNILCAVGVGVALGIPTFVIGMGINKVASVPGRLERLSDKAGRHVFVDYAHTPDALENVLATLREISAGRLICVFGCGGDRDTGKRPKMGEIAGKMSDLAVITSDNPRTEAPLAIIEAIREGTRAVCPRQLTPAEVEASRGEAAAYVVEPDREKAILLAIQAARPGDAVLIAGKGHETYQIVGDRVLHFDDRETAKRGLAIN